MSPVPSPHATVALRASTKGEENKDWAAATPSGVIELTINNPAAVGLFQAAFDAKTDLAVNFSALLA